MGNNRFPWKNQLFKQGMAKQNQLRVFPKRTQLDKQALPVAIDERIPQWLRRQQESGVFIKQRNRITNRTAYLSHTIHGELFSLKLVEFFLDLRKGQPAQAIKKIMQVVAGGDGASLENELLVSHVVGQC